MKVNILWLPLVLLSCQSNTEQLEKYLVKRLENDWSNPNITESRLEMGKLRDSLLNLNIRKDIIDYLDGVSLLFSLHQYDSAYQKFSDVIQSGTKTCHILQFSYDYRGYILYEKKDYKSAIDNYLIAFHYGLECPMGEEHYIILNEAAICASRIKDFELSRMLLDSLINSNTRESIKEVARQNRKEIPIQ